MVITLNEHDPVSNTYLKGQSFFLALDDYEMLYIVKGPHMVRDSYFNLQFEVKNHILNNGEEKNYFTNFTLNGIQLERNLTNLKTSGEILAEIYNQTNGDIFTESLIGDFILLLTSALLHYNKFNQGKSSDDLFQLRQSQLLQYIKEAELFIFRRISEINNSDSLMY